eukprot:TRINITY_DN1330_c0_g1_i9.p1 TRINITY_DN1330_c0_g1~~TRINITY_DN1330_c0_g1_i9.p1  ORF type:complete len:210 (-),score=52.11 TRINITY_DN1330_c0_g1_i9:375-1004(-)
MQTQIMIACGVLPQLSHLLSHQKRGIRKEACWTISNITAGTPDQIQAVINHQLIPPLIHLLRKGEFDVKKEAAWAISNATSGATPDQIDYLVEAGCIPPLCDLLLSHDPRIVGVVLEGIVHILKAGLDEQQRLNLPHNRYARITEECGGVDKFEELQNHDDDILYLKAQNVIKEYFQGREGDSELTPPATPQSFTFVQPTAPTNGFSFQ